MFSPVLYEYFGYGTDERSGPKTTDIYFDGDISHYMLRMTDRQSLRHRASYRHPLMSLVMYPPVKALRLVGVAPKQAIRITIATVCGAWMALMFFLLLLWGCRILDATVFSLLGLTSASSIFWLAVPESFSFGSASILMALILTLWPPQVRAIARYAAAIVVSITMSVTNVMVGLIGAAKRLSGREFWIAVTSAWFIITMLWGVQKLIFPLSEFFFPLKGTYGDYLFVPTPARMLQVVQTLWSHAIVMPEIKVLAGPELHERIVADRMMSVQQSLVGSAGLLGFIATMAWLALLGLAAWAAWTTPSGLSNLCLLVLAGQTALHVFFGSETFLYSLHVLPLLVVLAAGVAFTRLRLVGLALAAMVILLGGPNNWVQFQKAVAIVQEIDSHARTFPGAKPP